LWSGKHMKTIQHTSTLFYYDGSQVFEARDAIGGHYVAVMVEPENGKDRYLVAGVEPERLREFRAGLLDLRNLLVERQVVEWFLVVASKGLTEPLVLQPSQGSLADSPFLPDPGFVLHDRPADEMALREARARNNLVFELAVDPPEAAEENRIRVGTLVGLLNHVQMMVKHAYGAALRDLSLATRRAIDRSNAHLMDVIVPAKEGSFRIVLEAAKTPDLLGQSELARALERVDALFEKAADPEQAAEVLRANRGHLAGAYLRLLRFLIQHNTGLRYSWAEPTSPKQSNRSISEGEAAPLVSLLSGVSNLGSEPVTLLGSLEEADVTKRTWRVATPDGKYSGEVKPGGPSLEGLRLGGAYKFSCIEEIEEAEGTGREQRTLYLVEHRPT
jgi:hypothetical protein